MKETNLSQFLKNVEKQNLNQEELIKYLYNFVRDDILFDFLPGIDDVSAEEIFRLKAGQCNNKTLLFFEMLKYFKIKARVHYSTIKKEIHRGLFPPLMFLIAPKEVGHSWIEVELNSKWITLDGYINDNKLFNSAVKIIAEKGWDIGYSVAQGSCGASSDFSLLGDNFVQMEGVLEDLGTTTEPLKYLRSKENPNNVNVLKKFLYRLQINILRRNVKKARAKYS